MCGPAILPMLQAVGSVAAVAGPVIQGIGQANAARQQAAIYNQEATQQAQLTSIQDQRQRDQFQSAIAQQRAELAARGITLDSVTAAQLGMAAAKEMEFQSQSTRSQGAAQVAQLQNASALSQADATNALLSGTFSAASSLVNLSPDIWPGLQTSGQSLARINT